MEQVAYIIENQKKSFKGFIALLTPDENDSALFVTNSTKNFETLEEAQNELNKLPKDIKIFLNPIQSSEHGLSWLSELKRANS